MRRVYLAHQLSAPTREGIEDNRRSAAKWAAWISTTFHVAVSADWIWLTGELDESHRAFGFECDLAHIERCDELWMVGAKVSEGMHLEAQHAAARGLPVYDLTGHVRHRELIEYVLQDRGRCLGCGLSSINCARTQSVLRAYGIKCCPDCTHRRDHG